MVSEILPLATCAVRCRGSTWKPALLTVDPAVMNYTEMESKVNIARQHQEGVCMPPQACRRRRADHQVSIRRLEKQPTTSHGALLPPCNRKSPTEPSTSMSTPAEPTLPEDPNPPISMFQASANIAASAPPLSQTLNEIMPMIYRRFTEKTAEEWRQIYKALQLLEFLIKHGSERVIDDARSHLTLLKMLRQFHYIDPNGKDQGINVRNRAKELAELLGDVDRIRAERKKARANKAKYTGVEGGSGGGFSSSSRYGGFGSESGGYGGGGGGSSASYGGYSGGVYGDGGGFGGQTDEWRGSGGGGGSSSRADKFEEYDEFDEGEKKPAASHGSSRPGVKRTTGGSSASSSKAAEPPKKKEPEVDLFSFDDPAPSSSAAAAPLAPSAGSGFGSLAPTAANNDDDEFDDFQSAAPAQPLAPPMVTSTASNAQFAAPKPVSAPQQANLGAMVGLSSVSPPPATSAVASPPAANYSSLSNPMTSPPQPTGYQAAQPNYFTSVQAGGSQPPSLHGRQGSAAGSSFGGMTPVSASSTGAPAAKPAAKSAGGDAFGSLWSQASVGVKKASAPSAGPAMGQLAKEKSAAGIWGTNAAAPAAPAAGANRPAPPPGTTSGSASNDLADLLG